MRKSERDRSLDPGNLRTKKITGSTTRRLRAWFDYFSRDVMVDDGDTDFEVVEKNTFLNEMTTTLAEWGISLGDFWGILVSAIFILLVIFVTYQLWKHPIRKRNPNDIRSWFTKTPPPPRKRLHRIILDRLWDTRSIR